MAVWCDEKANPDRVLLTGSDQPCLEDSTAGKQPARSGFLRGEEGTQVKAPRQERPYLFQGWRVALSRAGFPPCRKLGQEEAETPHLVTCFLLLCISWVLSSGFFFKPMLQIPA